LFLVGVLYSKVELAAMLERLLTQQYLEIRHPDGHTCAFPLEALMPGSKRFAHIVASTLGVLVLSQMSLMAATRPETPQPPVIFLHYDYMVASDHSDAPQDGFIDLVVDAFKQHGIILHIDPQHTAIPEDPVLVFDANFPGSCSGTNRANFTVLKQQYFQPKGNLPWHYMIFGHSIVNPGPGFVDCDTPNAGGAATLPGYDFAIGLGALRSIFCPPDNSNFAGCRIAEGGTFMHELGHNLDLHHGGADEVNYKPNYLSVMNYNYQIAGIRFAANPGSTQAIGTRLDYSEFALPDLDENHLDERIGLGGPPTDSDIAFYSCEIDTSPCFSGLFVPAYGPVDWNLNGTIEPDIRLDLNTSDEMIPGAPFDPSNARYDLLTGFDDWRHVHEFLGTANYKSGTVRAEKTAP
jgi:hypothetical protein